MSEPKSNDEVALTNGTTPPPSQDAKSNVPTWLKPELFQDILQKKIKGFKQIKQFKTSQAVAAGENYATIMLRIAIDVELEDNSTKTVTYMIKLPHDTELYKQMMEGFNMFDSEAGMYLDIVPEMEEMYRTAGLEVKFGAACYKLNTKHSNVLLEDLRPYGFKNTNRLEGLDMDHIKSVLKKLSQWHAASATRVAIKGHYPDVYKNGFLKEESKELVGKMFEGINNIFLECLRNNKACESYVKAAENFLPHINDALFDSGKLDPNDFSVLNHGDCWSNNIMFQYDDFGKIKETFMVDYQIPMYGSPAQDLLYFIVSSAKLELKVECFDFFIKFYHDCLVEHLNLLKYPKKIPSLKELHMSLFKYGIWGYTTATGVMAAVLAEPSENANLDNFIGESAEGADFKKQMYSNARYQKHIEVLLPWLYNRGVLEC